MARLIVLNSETGLDEDYNQRFMCTCGYQTQYRTGQITKQEFLKKITECLPKYEQFLEQKVSDGRLTSAEKNYCMLTADPRAVRKVDKVTKDFKNLSSFHKENRDILVNYEKLCKKNPEAENFIMIM